MDDMKTIKLELERINALLSEILHAMKNEDNLIEVPEAAQLARVSTKTIYGLVAMQEKNGIPAVRFGNRIKFPKGAFIQWRDGNPQHLTA